MIDDIVKMIRKRDLSNIISLMLINSKSFTNGDVVLKEGYKIENEIWDYKSKIPDQKNDSLGWAEIAKDVLSFHNNRGGLIFFGISDHSFTFTGVKTKIDSKIFNDKIRKYIGDTFWVDFQRIKIQENQTSIGVALIPPRGPRYKMFQKDSPMKKNNYLFLKGGSALRTGDSSKVYSPQDALKFNKIKTGNKIGNYFFINQDGYRILAPEYKTYIERDNLIDELIDKILLPKYTTISIVGIGGVGKTATATEFCVRAYERELFEYIVSITAKDRELTQQGIIHTLPELNTFENLLDSILEVLDFVDLKGLDMNEKIEEVKQILGISKTLLFVDNLETILDYNIIDFLNDLPAETKCIVTSRNTRVKNSIYPKELLPFNGMEINRFIHSIGDENGFDYIKSMKIENIKYIGNSCEGIPLAIRWILSSSKSVDEAVSKATQLTSSGCKGEELLEFSFRRIFDSLNNNETQILKIISLFPHPITIEMILTASDLHLNQVEDAIDDLSTDTLITKIFDIDQDDYCFTALYIVKKFINTHTTELEDKSYRNRLKKWYNADDVNDPVEKELVKSIRNNTEYNISNIIDSYRTRIKKRDIPGAEDILIKALNKYSTNFKLFKELGIFYKQYKKDTQNALKYLNYAINYSPHSGTEKAFVHKEYAFVLDDSGFPNSRQKALEHLLISFAENPEDKYTTTKIGCIYYSNSEFDKAIQFFEPHLKTKDEKTLRIIVPKLAKSYQAKKEIIKLSGLKQNYGKYIN